jgi:hypothetical protein
MRLTGLHGSSVSRQALVRKRTTTAESRMLSIYPNLQSFTVNGDVSIWVKYFSTGGKTNIGNHPPLMVENDCRKTVVHNHIWSLPGSRDTEQVVQNAIIYYLLIYRASITELSPFKKNVSHQILKFRYQKQNFAVGSLLNHMNDFSFSVIKLIVNIHTPIL